MKRYPLSTIPLVAALLFGSAGGALARDRALAPTPPMGWNSWDCYGMSITEAELLDNARVLEQKLQPSGFRYVVMDAGWFNPSPELARKDVTPEVELDDFGRLKPVISRFPSAVLR